MEAWGTRSAASAVANPQAWSWCPQPRGGPSGRPARCASPDRTSWGAPIPFALCSRFCQSFSSASFVDWITQQYGRGLNEGVELPFKSVAEMRATYRKPSWLIKEWWPHPSYGMAAGPEKSLKSWLDIIENVSIASGEALFGRFEVVTPGPVVVFVGEGDDSLYYQRLRHVTRSIGMSDAEADALPIYVTDKRATTRDPDFQAWLTGALEQWEPVKVSLDPLYAYHGADVEAGNVHAAASAVLNAVSDRTQEVGASLKIINHFRKDVSGRLSLQDITQAGGGNGATPGAS